MRRAPPAPRASRITEELVNADAPASPRPHIVELIDAVSAQTTASRPKHMVSRAYHDSLFMARIAPIAMIFIPCRSGVSHRPDEYATPEDIALGTRVLAPTLAKLASE